MNHRNRTTIRMMSWMITALLPFPMIIHASPRLELKADSISYHDKTKVSEYHNHVNVIYGRSQFAGRDMLVKHKGSKAPEELTLSGKPVHFSIQHDLSQIQGQANQIIIYPEKSLALLQGNAVIFNGLETVRSQEIVYHLNPEKANNAKDKSKPTTQKHGSKYEAT